ncbi:MAG: ABC-type multidrug transport system fused ATPase/permease subunit [Verrucomicrobiales bacterium]|jgi:ABC-type multidrug transport system fused ATPase/permease subunit
MRSRSSQENTDASEAPKSKLNRESLLGASWIFRYLRPYRGFFYPALICLFVTSGLALVFPYMMGQLVGGSMSAAQGGDSADVSAITDGINRTAMILAGALALQAFIAYWRVRWFARAGERALADIRRETYNRIIRLPMAYFSEHRVGELSSRLASDLTQMRDTLIMTVPQIIRQSVMLLGGLTFVLMSSWKLSLFMLGTLPVVILTVAIVGRKIRGYSRDAQDRLAESSVVVEETLQAISDVKSFTNEAHETNRYSKTIDGFLSATLKAAGARAFFISFIIFVLFGTITLVVWFGAGMLQEGAITSEEFTRFVLFSVFVGAALGSLPEIVSQLQNSLGATQRVREILDTAPEGEDRPANPDNGQLARLTGAVELKDVRFSYPSRPDLEVLKGISFRASAGERIALVGPSGAGKSTIIQLLLAFYDADTGAVLYDEKDSRSLPLEFLRSQIAIVPQEVLLFGGSIRENIAYGKPGASDDEIAEAARQGNAHSFIESFPEGYDTVVGDRGIRLSGGQRQRIAIARAILADPAVLILDEATSSLDSESEQLVQEALDKLMQNRTSIIIAHRLATVRDADRIIVLKNGEIAESGTHTELSAKEAGVYRMLAELQFSA